MRTPTSNPKRRRQRNQPNDFPRFAPSAIQHALAYSGLGACSSSCCVAGTLTRAELTEEEKKELFLRAREKMRTVESPTPEDSATPHRKPKPAQHPPTKKKKSAKPNQLPSRRKSRPARPGR